MSRAHRTTETITLASGASATTTPVNCLGARRVHWSVTADVTHQLTAANVQARMSDGKLITLTPLAYPDGSADATTHELDAAGVLTTLDLSAATHRETCLRPMNGTVGPYALGILMGVDYASLTLTKANTAGPAVYTITCTVYFD